MNQYYNLILNNDNVSNVILDDIKTYILKPYLLYSNQDELINIHISIVMSQMAPDVIGYTLDSYDRIYSIIKHLIISVLNIESNTKDKFDYVEEKYSFELDELIKINKIKSESIKIIDSTYFINQVLKYFKYTPDLRIHAYSEIKKHLRKSDNFISSLDEDEDGIDINDIIKSFISHYEYSFAYYSKPISFNNFNPFDAYEPFIPKDIILTKFAKVSLYILIEYMLAEIIELSYNNCKNIKTNSINKQQVIYFLENNDKTEFKKMIVDCIYNNKFKKWLPLF